MKKPKRYPKEVVIAHAKANPATVDYAFGERSGGYTIGKDPSMKKSRRKKPINHATAQKIVVGIQVAILILELNDIIAEETTEREARAVGAIAQTLKEIRATLRTRA